MADLFLSPVLSVLMDKLTSPELLKFAAQEGVRSKLKKWENLLKMIKALVNDTEQKQLENEAVKMWLEELQDRAYDAEDILDEFATEALRRRLEFEEHQFTGSRARKLIPACCIISTPQVLWSDFRMRSRIDDITDRLQYLDKQKTELGLVEIAGGRSTVSCQRPPTTSFPIEPAIYGRDEDKCKILKLVLTHEPDDASFGVISIVGMGGLGKTTLAQLVYNDIAVNDFEPKAWFCVSDDFDIMKFSRLLLECITGRTCITEELNVVLNQLKDALNGKKFLIVLDDVWSMRDDLWENLKAVFVGGAPGSKIIVTTRSSDVASIMRTREYHCLPCLSDEECWSLFLSHASHPNHIVAQWNLIVIRKKVIEKCKGLPLAAMILGGILYNKETEDDWMNILGSKIWDLDDGTILPVLRLSYYHLPSHLKRCFTYCAIFPQDYEIRKKELIFLWMAEGLIQQSDNDLQLEDLGGQYISDLLSRSLFQMSASDNLIMHDLIHDLALFTSGKLSYTLEDELGSPYRSRKFEKTRYASYICHEYNDKGKFDVFNDARHLRTLLSIQPANNRVSNCYISDGVISSLFLRFKKLRVLSLQNYYIVEIPDSIGGLILLKYLNLSNSQIKSLPNSVNSLCNLQTLILGNCCRLLKWPGSMENLINLRHLDVLGASSIEHMPVGIRRWEHLRTLSNFIVGKDSKSSLRDLMHLKFLCGELHISGLENVIDFEDTKESILNDKKDLKVLSLEWGSRSDGVQDEEVEEKVLDMLQPHHNLEKLKIICYGGTKFSSWFGGSFLCESKITIIELRGCKKSTCLPSLGLLGSLRNITIKGMKAIKKVGSEFYGAGQSKPFQSLETLYFEDLEEWAYWDSVNCPKLQELAIINCPKLLERLPDNLSSLKELTIVNCPKLSERLPNNLSSLERLVIRGCEDLVVLLSNIPRLCELKLEKCKMIEWSSSNGYKSLKSLKIGDCNELIELCQNEVFLKKPSQGLHNLISSNKLTEVEELRIEKCDSLRFIFGRQLPPSLRKLSITACEQLQSLLNDNDDTSTSSSGLSSAIMPFVKNVDSSTSRLEDLYINGCPSLTYLPSSDRLSTTLTRLRISNCSKLKTLLPSGHLPEALQNLLIDSCAELTTLLPGGQLPKNLETLKISDCRMLVSLPNGLNKLSYLSQIHLSHCDALASFPEGGFPSSTNLQVTFAACGLLSYCPGFSSLPEGGFSNDNLRVWVKECPKLKPPPNRVQTLPSLAIYNCPNMSFPEEGLPPGLSRLSIDNFNFYKPLMERGLQKLTVLRDLQLSGWQGAESFQEEAMKTNLPRTLTLLSIEKFPNLKYLPSLGDLLFLEKFAIIECPKVESLPSLPPSLLRLDISDCPLLKETCRRDRGREWPKIANIPCVMIDSEFIYDPEEETSMN